MGGDAREEELLDTVVPEVLQRLADGIRDGEPISNEEAIRRIRKFATEAAPKWVDSLSDEEAGELVEKHDLVGATRHLRKVGILRYRKAMRLAGNTKAVDEANRSLKWLEDNRY